MQAVEVEIVTSTVLVASSFTVDSFAPDSCLLFPYGHLSVCAVNSATIVDMALVSS